MNRGMPLWAKLAIAAFVLLVVGAVGGPFVYIHFIEGKAPAPLSVNTSPSSTASATPSRMVDRSRIEIRSASNSCSTPTSTTR